MCSNCPYLLAKIQIFSFHTITHGLFLSIYLTNEWYRVLNMYFQIFKQNVVEYTSLLNLEGTMSLSYLNHLSKMLFLYFEASSSVLLLWNRKRTVPIFLLLQAIEYVISIMLNHHNFSIIVLDQYWQA